MRVVTAGEMKSVHFMLVIASDSFQMSKTKLKVAVYWIKVDKLKQFAENFSYLSFGTSCVVAAPLSSIRISE